jgi:hypothetical protein
VGIIGSDLDGGGCNLRFVAQRGSDAATSYLARESRRSKWVIVHLFPY